MSDSNYVVRGELGSYEVFVDEKLGEGGFGQVFAARNEATGERLAIKLFLARDPRVLAGIRAQRQLEHPRLLPVRDAGTDRGQAFLVMDRAHGTIAARLEAGALADHEALLAFYDAALGLRYLHERGLVHRDVKPSNMLLDARGRVLLSDFDLVQEVAVETRTVVNSAAGTFAYCAPELFGTTGGSPPADVWALGVSMYELLSARRPFEGNTWDGSLLKALREGQAPSLVAQRSEFDFWEELLAPLLAKPPAERPSVGALFGGRFRTFVRYAVDVCWERQEYARAFDLLSAAERTAAMKIDLVLAGAAAGKKMTKEPRVEEPNPRLQAAMQAALSVARECPAIAPQVRGAILAAMQDELAPAFDDVALARELRQGPPFVGPEREQCGALASEAAVRYLTRYPNGRERARLQSTTSRAGRLIMTRAGAYTHAGFTGGGYLAALNGYALELFGDGGATPEITPIEKGTQWLAVSPGGRIAVVAKSQLLIVDELGRVQQQKYRRELRAACWLGEGVVALFDGDLDLCAYFAETRTIALVEEHTVTRGHLPLGSVGPDTLLLSSQKQRDVYHTLRFDSKSSQVSIPRRMVYPARPLCLPRRGQLLTCRELLSVEGEPVRVFDSDAPSDRGSCASHDERIAVFFGAHALTWRLLDPALANTTTPVIELAGGEEILGGALDADGSRLALIVKTATASTALRLYVTGLGQESAS